MNWQQLSTSSLEEVFEWARKQPWCQAMASCQQDAEWHAEGDVWTHTQMVCRQLELLDEWPDLSQREKTVLVFTALFHDSAKPITSGLDPASGRIRSPKHAIHGEKIARNTLRELECDVVLREEIARMVRFHGRPVFLSEKADAAYELISLSWLVNHKLLYLFALADSRGRTTNSMSRSEETLAYWRLVAEENDCFEKPFPFANEHSRFLFYRQSNPDRHYVAYEDYSCTVTLMSGLPGSGKDTWLAKHRSRIPVVALDSLREELDVEATENQGQVVQLARERCRELLRSKTSFAFNATNLLRLTRRRWIDLFASYGARIETVYVEPTMRTIRLQNKKRDRKVPEKVILDLAQRCEPPNLTESHELLVEFK
jgi:predicted kinase